MSEKIVFPAYLRSEIYGKGNVPTRVIIGRSIGKSRYWVDAAKRGSDTARITQEHLDIWEDKFQEYKQKNK